MRGFPREGPTAVRVRGGSHGGDGPVTVRQDDSVEGRGGERAVAVRPRGGSYGGEKLARRSVTIPDLRAAAAGAGLQPTVATASSGPKPAAATGAGAGAPHRPPAAAIPDLVGPGPADGAEEAEEGGHYSGLFKEYAKERQQQGRAARAPIGGKRQPRIWIRSRSDSNAKPTTTPGAGGRSAGGRHGAGFGRSSSNSSGGVGGGSNVTCSSATTGNAASMAPRPPATVNSLESGGCSEGSGKLARAGSFLLFDPERRANTTVHSQEILKEKQPNKKVVTPPHKPPATANGGGGGGAAAAASPPRPAPTSPAVSGSPCSVVTSLTVSLVASTAAPSSAATSTAAVERVPAPSSSSAPPEELNSNPCIQGIQQIDQGDAKAGHRSNRLDAAEVSAAAAQLEMDASCPSPSMVGGSKAVTDHARHSRVPAGRQSATTIRGREERIAPPPIAASSAPQSLRGKCAATCLGDRSVSMPMSEAHRTVIRLDPCAISSTPLFACWRPRCEE